MEPWFYTARNEKKDPVQALRRKIRFDQGGHLALRAKVRQLQRTFQVAVSVVHQARKMPTQFIALMIPLSSSRSCDWLAISRDRWHLILELQANLFHTH
jgi:hypothetical protein